jgi:hypothetical protein
MTPQEEQAYLQGEKMAWSMMAQQCIRNLQCDSEIKTTLGYLRERNEAINRLRELCQDFGDNDWEDDLHLADIIEKHLGRPLYNNFEPIREAEQSHEHRPEKAA